MSGERRVPAAIPVVWSNHFPRPPQDGAAKHFSATTTTRSGRSPSSRVGRHGLAAVRASLSARDRQVLRGVADHRYLTTVHVQGLYFFDHATPLTGARVCRRVLRRLAELRVLTSLERRVGGVRAGSASFVWQLGPIGDRLLREADQPRLRRHEPGRLFLDHCLAIADAHLALVSAHRAGQIELIDAQLEPDCWRPYSGISGARLMLQPDLYVVTGDPADQEFVNSWFIEIDRGTEHRKRLLDKCARYEHYRRTGTEQKVGGSFPLVVWVMADEAQANRLNAAIHADRKLDDGLYRVTTVERFVELIEEGAA